MNCHRPHPHWLTDSSMLASCNARANYGLSYMSDSSILQQ